MVDIFGFNVMGLSLEATRAIVTDPIYMDALFTTDYRIQSAGVNKDIESKLLTVAHRQYPLRRVDGCEIPEAEARAITQRSFVPRQIGYQEKFCKDDWKSTILALLAKQNLRQSDLTGTQMGALLAQMTAAENKKHLLPMAWFANQSSNDPRFNQIKGFWALIQEAVGQNLTPRINTYANVTLSAGDGIQILLDVIKNATDALDAVAQNDKVLYITRKVYDQLRDDVSSGLQNSALYQQRIEGAQTVTRFDGIEIRVMREWDALATTLMAYTGNSNLVCLTMKQNLVWAINDTEDLSFEAFYDQTEMKYYMRNLFVFGVQIDHPNLLSVAY